MSLLAIYGRIPTEDHASKIDAFYFGVISKDHCITCQGRLLCCFWILRISFIHLSVCRTWSEQALIEITEGNPLSMTLIQSVLRLQNQNCSGQSKSPGETLKYCPFGHIPMKVYLGFCSCFKPHFAYICTWQTIYSQISWLCSSARVQNVIT